MTRNTIREDLQNKQCQEDPGCDAVLRFVEVNSKIFSLCLSLTLSNCTVVFRGRVKMTRNTIREDLQHKKMSGESWLRRSASIHRDQVGNIQYMRILVLVRLYGCTSETCENDEKELAQVCMINHFRSILVATKILDSSSSIRKCSVCICFRRQPGHAIRIQRRIESRKNRNDEG